MRFSVGNSATARILGGKVRLSAFLLGFSFSGEVREPFPAVIKALEETRTPVTSVDAPSSWNIETGPPESGLGRKFNPDFLISLTAPKPLVNHFKGRHFIGGRFVATLEEVNEFRVADSRLDSSPLQSPRNTISRSQRTKELTSLSR